MRAIRPPAPRLTESRSSAKGERAEYTRGFADVLARFLRERGLDAGPLATRFTGEAPPDQADVDDAGDAEA